MELFQTRKTSSTMKYPRAHSANKLFSLHRILRRVQRQKLRHSFCAACIHVWFLKCVHSSWAQKKWKKKQRNINTHTNAYEILRVRVPISKYVGKTWHKTRMKEWRNWTKAKEKKTRPYTQSKMWKRNDMNTFEIDVLKHVVKDKYHGK